MNGVLHYVFLTLAFTVVSGCMVGPDHRTPDPLLSKNWSAARESTIPLQPLDQATLMVWWNTFNDPMLTQLILKARDQNLDLKMVYERIEQARSEQNANRADLFPRVSIAGTVARASNVFPIQGPTGNAFDYFLTGFDAVWEIDVFGRLRRRLQAAEAQTAAATEDYRQAFVVLAAEVAREYVNYRGQQETQQQSDLILASLKEKAALVERRIQDGLSTRDELDRVRSLEASTRAEQKTLEAHLASTRHRLELLVGKQPEALRAQLAVPSDVPVVPDRRLLTQPASTLRYRPDVRGAELELASATAMEGAAIAELFPKISIAAFLGLHNSDLENLFRSSAFAWASAASISQPLFNFGKIRAGIALAEARQREAYLNYEKTVLAALHECETAFAEWIKETQRQEELQQSLARLQSARELAEQRFQDGLGTRQTSIDADIEVRLESIRLVQSRAVLATRLVALFKALGGAGLEPVKAMETPLRPWG